MQGAVWIAVILTQAFLGKRRPRRPVESEPGIEAVRDPHRFGPGQHDKGGGDRDGHVLDEDPDLVDLGLGVLDRRKAILEVLGKRACGTYCRRPPVGPMRRGSPGRAGGHRRDIAQHLDLIPGQLGEGEAERNVGLAVERAVLAARRPAGRAQAASAAFGILLAFRRLAPVAARPAGRPALDGRMLAAADAQGGLAPRLLALPALGAGATALGVRIGAAVEHTGGLAGSIAGAVGLAARRQARLARSAVGGGRRLAAPGAETLCNALCRLAAGPLAFGGARLGGIAARLAFHPEPGVAGAARLVVLCGTRVADAALRRGRAVAASGTKTLCNAFRGAPVEAFAVKEDKRAIFRAASEAQKAADFVLPAPARSEAAAA